MALTSVTQLLPFALLLWELLIIAYLFIYYDTYLLFVVSNESFLLLRFAPLFLALLIIVYLFIYLFIMVLTSDLLSIILSFGYVLLYLVINFLFMRQILYNFWRCWKIHKIKEKTRNSIMKIMTLLRKGWNINNHRTPMQTGKANLRVNG